MSEFELVAMGGTFDIIHKGHMALLQKAFSIASRVIIGLTGDELATKKGKTPTNSYQQRFDSLTSLIKENFPDKSFEISKLDNDFGPAVTEGNVQALVVSEETNNKGDLLNQIRKDKNLPLVDIITVPMILADDGNRISTTRIKNSEIDSNGKLL